jgi:hypothetical protein
MVVDGQQYQYDRTGNYYSGDSATTFNDLHLNTNWVNIVNDNITGINDTLGSTNPDLQATSGIVQFGFITWSGSSGSNLPVQNRYIRVDQFEVDFTYTEAVPEPAMYGLILGAAGLLFVVLRRRRG